MTTTRHRRNLRFWVLRTYGDGATAPCWVCGTALDCVTMTLDRHPIPGHRGGRYIRKNLRPACVRCNTAHLGPREDCPVHPQRKELRD